MFEVMDDMVAGGWTRPFARTARERELFDEPVFGRRVASGSKAQKKRPDRCADGSEISPMTDFDRQLETLQALTPKQLRERYTQLTGDVIHSGNKVGLVKRVAWQLQAQVQGDLSALARRRALELAATTAIRELPPRKLPPPSEAPSRRPAGVSPNDAPPQEVTEALMHHSSHRNAQPPSVSQAAASMTSAAVAGRTATHRVRFAGDPRLPAPGTTLTRVYKGRTVKVRVLPEGFEWEGRRYRSLSAVAKAITGSHCSGYTFFELTDPTTRRDRR